MCWCDPSKRTPNCGQPSCNNKMSQDVLDRLLHLSELLDSLNRIVMMIDDRLDALEDRLDRVHEI